MEPSDRDQVKISKKELGGCVTAERENEMVATILRKIKEGRRDLTYAAAVVKELGKQPQGSDAGRKHVEAALRGQIEELNNKVIEKERLETTLRSHIKKLENKVREEYSDRVSVEFKLPCKVSELRETDSDKKEAESALLGQREYYERKLQKRNAIREHVEVGLYGEINRLQEQLQERDTISEQVKNAHHDEINRLLELLQKSNAISVEVRNLLYGRISRLQEQLQERNRAVRDLEATVHVLHHINRATSNERDTTINQIQERDRDARNTRVACNVNERRIFERNTTSRWTKKGVVSVAAVTVAVGAVVAGWWFLS